jgi:transcription elongation factor Elf1
MDLVDSKYVGMISSRLEKFKKVKADLYNFRCPICGDSQKNKNKTRGYIYQVKNNTNFKCHNCGASMSFNNFLKKMDTVMHKQYTLEKFKEGHTGRNFVVKEPKFEFKKPVFTKKIDLPKASSNPFANMIGFQGRVLDKSPNKYITIMIQEDAPKIYGLETIDTKLPIYVVEGPFDSTFISNSVALCGSDGDLGYLEGSNTILVYDNEPRNREIVKRIEQCIDRNQRVVIWPSNIVEKDINDMVLSGHHVEDVLKSNTYHGLEAKIKFNNWKKI